MASSVENLIPVAAVSPVVHLADPVKNAEEILAAAREAVSTDARLIVFPELSLTGATCEDFFLQPFLLEAAKKELRVLIKKTKNIDALMVVGLPLLISQKLYNVAAVFTGGKLLGFVPKFYGEKTHCPERRWFSDGAELNAKVDFFGEQVPCNTLLNFKDSLGSSFKASVIVGDVPFEKLSCLADFKLGRKTIIANPHATPAIAAPVTPESKIQEAIQACNLAVVRAGAGEGESTTDVVMNGTCFLSTPEAPPLSFSETGWYVTYFDGACLKKPFSQTAAIENALSTIKNAQREKRNTKADLAKPYTTANPQIAAAVAEEAFSIQTRALCQRLKATRVKKVVVGISGGLDSTLTLLVCANAFAQMGIPSKNIMAISMPGFGTTKKTKSNAQLLAESLHTTYQEIPIANAVKQHFKDIHHSPTVKNAAFENAQARERTQILMDVANDLQALVVGTGDMSESALGWATFNGDHMSMYNVNGGVPKTLVRTIVETLATSAAEKNDFLLAKTLTSIVDTPISPELLPPNKKGAIQQKTENLVGPYELHDFFLYYVLKEKFSPKEVYKLAKRAFPKIAPKTILKWLRVFYSRFFSQQFKRSCSVDGPQVVSFSLSPRGGLEMPSDASAALWLEEVKLLTKRLK